MKKKDKKEFDELKEFFTTFCKQKWGVDVKVRDYADRDSTAWCPDCGDEIFIENKTCKPYENWRYYCIGCDKHYELMEVK